MAPYPSMDHYTEGPVDEPVMAELSVHRDPNFYQESFYPNYLPAPNHYPEQVSQQNIREHQQHPDLALLHHPRHQHTQHIQHAQHTQHTQQHGPSIQHQPSGPPKGNGRRYNHSSSSQEVSDLMYFKYVCCHLYKKLLLPSVSHRIIWRHLTTV